MPKDKIQEGQPLTDDELFYYHWGQDTKRESINNCNDFLKQVISISSAMLALGLFFGDNIQDRIFKIIVAVLLLTSLLVAFIGIIPTKVELHLNIPNQIKQAKDIILKKKIRSLKISGGLLISAFTIMIIFLIYSELSK